MLSIDTLSIDTHLSKSSFYNALGQIIKERREWSGMTQTQLANQVNSHSSTICRVEKGYQSSIRLINDIAGIFLVNPVDLLREAIERVS